MLWIAVQLLAPVRDSCCGCCMVATASKRGRNLAKPIKPTWQRSPKAELLHGWYLVGFESTAM